MRGNEPTTLTIDEIRERMAEINPNFDATDPANEFTQNCGDTSSILNDVLNGGPVRQAGTDTLTIEQMRARTGFEQTSMTPTEIADALRRMGAGSHAVVGVDRAGGQDGHWFNVYFDGTDVWTLDAQTNEIGGFPPHEPDAIHWDVSIEVERPDTMDAPGADADATSPADEFAGADRGSSTPISDRIAAGTDPTGVATPPPGASWANGADLAPTPKNLMYGSPMAVHGVAEPAPAPQGPHSGYDMVAHPDHSYGNSGMSRSEYERIYKLARQDSTTGIHWDNYPPNDGAVRDTRRVFDNLLNFSVEYGDRFDRIGDDRGTYLGLAPDGQPATWEQRALPVSSLGKPVHDYRLDPNAVLPPRWTIEISRIAPGFGHQGGGLQVQVKDADGVPQRARMLAELGIIKEVGGVS